MAFPTNPTDGMLYCDENGVFFIYKSNINSWIELRNYSKPDVVTYKESGLMSSDDFTKLERIIIPPFNTSLTINGTKYEYGSISFFADNPLEISYSISTDTPFVIKNDYGFINFDVDIIKFYETFLASDQISSITVYGETGADGDIGDAGIDRLETGPEGNAGQDGKNSPFAGNLIIDPVDYRPFANEKVISDIYSYKDSSTGETIINAIRSYIGNPELCCTRIKINNFKSPFLILTEPTIDRKELTDWEKEKCLICHNLYYININNIIDKIHNRFKQMIQDYVSNTTIKVINWLRDVALSFNEQKQILCCGLEQCKTRERNIQDRRYLEDHIIDSQYNKETLELISYNKTALFENDLEETTSREITLYPDKHYDEAHAVTIDLPDGEYLVEIIDGYLKYKGKYFCSYNIWGGSTHKFESEFFDTEEALIEYYQPLGIIFEHSQDDGLVKLWLQISKDIDSARIDGNLQIKINTKAAIDERKSDYSDVLFMYNNEINPNNYVSMINKFNGSETAINNLNNDGTVNYGPADIEAGNNFGDGLRVFFYNDEENTTAYIINRKEDGETQAKIHVEILDNNAEFGVVSSLGNPTIKTSNIRHNYDRNQKSEVEAESITVTTQPTFREDLSYYEFRSGGGEIPIWVNFNKFPKIEKLSDLQQGWRANQGKSRLDPLVIEDLYLWQNRGALTHSDTTTDQYSGGVVVTKTNTEEVVVSHDFSPDNNNPLNISGGYKQYEFLYPINVPSFVEEVKDLKLYIDIDCNQTNFQHIAIELRPPAYYKTIEDGIVVNKPVLINNWGTQYSSLNVDPAENKLIFCDNNIYWMNQYTPNNLTPLHGGHTGYRTSSAIQAATTNDLEFYATGKYNTNLQLPWFGPPIKLTYLQPTRIVRDRDGGVVDSPNYIKNSGPSVGKYRGFIEIVGEGEESYDKFTSNGDIDFDVYDYNRVRLGLNSSLSWYQYQSYGLGARDGTYAYSLSEYIQQWQNVNRKVFKTTKYEEIEFDNELNKKYPYGGGTWWLTIKVIDTTGEGQQIPYGFVGGVTEIPSTFPKPILNEWGLYLGTDSEDEFKEEKSGSVIEISGNALDIEFNTKETTEAVILGNFDSGNESDFIFTVDFDTYYNIDDVIIYSNRSNIRNKDIYTPTESISIWDSSENKPKYETLIFNKNASGCRMHYKLIDWYERGWRTGACCGVVVEYNNQNFIIMKRSLLDDMSCGGGETYNGCVGNYIINKNIHPYFMFPTDSKMEIFSNSAAKISGYTRFIEDDVLSDILIDKINNNEYLTYKGDIDFIKNDIKLILFQSIFTEQTI